MKLANLAGRAAIVVDGGAIDVATATGGAIGPEPQSVYDHWADLVALDLGGHEPRSFDDADLLAPTPMPRQVFGIGLNYGLHAQEAGMELPKIPATFTKFPTSITGPTGEVELRGPTTDWEVELVVVIGARAERVAEADAWAHVAGFTIGQDLSERTVQFAAGNQFSLGKSYPGYAPVGPYVVTVDEVADPNDLAIGCSIDGEVVQDGRTSDLVFGVASLVAQLSDVCPLLPGDIVFTGTPAGVGFTRTPPRFLQPGAVLESWIEGLGRMRHTFR